MEALRDRGVDAELTMAGKGALADRTRTHVAQRGLDDRIRVPGWADVAAELADAHALLHTATWEGLPRVMLEAVAVGRRTYAFDVKGVRDVPYAQLVADEDVPGLAALIAREWQSGALRRTAQQDASGLCSRAVAAEMLAFLRGTIVPAGVGEVRAASGRTGTRAA